MEETVKEFKTCQECQVASCTNWHSPYCSQATLEQIREEYRRLDELSSHNRKAFDIQRKRLQEDLVRWQGKFLIVKNENNKLRKKLKSVP